MPLRQSTAFGPKALSAWGSQNHKKRRERVANRRIAGRENLGSNLNIDIVAFLILGTEVCPTLFHSADWQQHLMFTVS